jgi:outer membrane protein OmpA-like peptidoglycan-associated protein
MDLVIAIREAFNNPVDPNSASAVDIPLIRRIIERSGPSQAEEGQIGREHDTRSIRPSTYFSPAGSIPFGDGSAILSETGQEALRQMQKVVRGHNLVIEARGHASAAEAFGQADRGLKLSYERALAVAQALTAEGVSWSQLRVVACGDSERLIPNAYDEAAHRANQRVEIIVTDQIVKSSSGESESRP